MCTRATGRDASKLGGSGQRRLARGRFGADRPEAEGYFPPQKETPAMTGGGFGEKPLAMTYSCMA